MQITCYLHFLMLFFFPYTIPKHLNTALYNYIQYIQDNSIFTSIFFCFYYNSLMHRINTSSMSDSPAISLGLSWKVLGSFLFL